MEKRKYSIGSLMLAYIAMINKSVGYLVFITNSDDLCQEMAKFTELVDVKYSENIWYLYEPSTSRSGLMESLAQTLVEEWKM